MESVEGGKYKKLLSYSVALMAIIAVFFVLKVASSFILPVIIALFLFILVNPFLNRCDKAKIPKPLSIIIAMLIVLVLFILFIYTFSMMINSLMAQLPSYVQRVNQLDVRISNSLRSFFDVGENEPFSVLQMLNIDWFGIITSFLTSASSKFVNIFGDCMLIYLYLFFMIVERATIYPKIIVSLPEERGKKVMAVVTSMSKKTSRYLILKVVVSAVTGCLFYLTAFLMRLDFALVWGIMAFILNFIPTIGSIIVTAGAVFMAILQFMPHWGYITIIALILIAIQMVLGNIIEPRIQGNQLNLSPLAILISLALWSYIWGIAGMFLAVPLTALLQITCSQSPTLKPIAIFISTGSIAKPKKKRFFSKQRAKWAKKMGKGEIEGEGASKDSKS